MGQSIHNNSEFNNAKAHFQNLAKPVPVIQEKVTKKAPIILKTPSANPPEKAEFKLALTSALAKRLPQGVNNEQTQTVSLSVNS